MRSNSRNLTGATVELTRRAGVVLASITDSVSNIQSMSLQIAEQSSIASQQATASSWRAWAANCKRRSIAFGCNGLGARQSPEAIPLALPSFHSQAPSVARVGDC